MSNDKTYDALLKKLINGNISEEERWQLERASLDDPFLADALEGYYNSDENQEEKTISLHEKYKTKSHEPRRIKLFRIVTAAASLLILISLGFWTITSLQKDTITSFDNSAELEKTDSPISSSQGITLSEDSITEVNVDNQLPDESPKAQVAESKEKPTVPKARSKPEAPRAPKKSQAIQATPESSEQAQDQIVSSRAIPIQAIENIEPVKVSGIVRNTSGMPIIGAEIKSKNQDFITYSDSAGRFKMELSEEDMIMASFSGFEPTSMQSDDFLEITLAESVSAFADVNKPLAEFMDEESLENHYRKKLNESFKKYKTRFCVNYQDNINISINEEGGLDNIRFSNSTSEECKNEITDQLRQWSFEGLFDGNQTISFNYRLKF